MSSLLTTGLFICDRDGIIRFINDAYANYLRARPPGRCHGPPHTLRISSPIPTSGGHRFRRAGTRRMAEHTGQRKEDLVGHRSATRTGIIGVLPDLFDTPEQMQALLQRVDFPDKKVNSPGASRAPRASHTINSILGNSPAITAAPESTCATRGPNRRSSSSARPEPARTGGQRIHMASNRPDGLRQHQLRGHPEGAVRMEVRSSNTGYVPGAFSARTRTAKSGRRWPSRPHRSSSTSGIFLYAQVKLLGCWRRKPLPARIVAAPGRGFPACRRDQRDLKNDRGGDVPRRPVLPHQPHDLNLCALGERVEDIP